MGRLIYIADDESNIRNLIKGFLVREGYEVEDFADGEELLERYRKKQSDLVILDVMMPGRDGFAITEELRSISKVPIILLTARDSDSDLALGITIGSDDYITKPFSPMTLTMKVKALFRRIDMDNEESKEKELEFLDIRIDTGKKSVSIKGEEISLAPNEYNLIRYMVENRDRAVSREELLEKVWGFSEIVETRVTDDTLKRLRKKIKDSDVLIETVWGYGYRLRKKDRNDE